MKIEKRNLNETLRVLGKVVCQTSPVELYQSVRFVGDVDGVMAMVTDGVETVSVILDAFTETEIDFCVPFKELKDLVRIGRSETIELSGTYIEFPELEEPTADAISEAVFRGEGTTAEWWRVLRLAVRILTEILLPQRFRSLRRIEAFSARKKIVFSMSARLMIS